jgi:hypothetical protein
MKVLLCVLWWLLSGRHFDRKPQLRDKNIPSHPSTWIVRTRRTREKEKQICGEIVLRPSGWTPVLFIKFYAAERQTLVSY